MQVAPAPSEPAPHALCHAVDAPARDTVEVVLVNGRCVRFHAQMDARTLHALLAALVGSLVETAKLNEVEPYAWLWDVLTRMVDGHPQQRLDELLPWNRA